MAKKTNRIIYREGGPLDGENIEYEGDLIQQGYEQLTPFPGGRYVWKGGKKKNGDRIIVWVEDGIEGG